MKRVPARAKATAAVRTPWAGRKIGGRLALPRSGAIVNEEPLGQSVVCLEHRLREPALQCERVDEVGEAAKAWAQRAEMRKARESDHRSGVSAEQVLGPLGRR